MKIFPPALVAVAVAVSVATIIDSAVASTDVRAPPEPTALEAFVARPGVVLDLAEEIGSIRSSDATLVVAAVIASDTGRPGERMKGVRFAMQNNSRADLAYLDETQLAALLDNLSGIEGGIPELKSGGDAPYRVQGTAACWQPERPMRILCPSYRIGPDWAGMMLGAYGSGGFEFPGHRPAELAALVREAIARLQTP